MLFSGVLEAWKKYKTVTYGQTQPKDHKKVLLSLWTKDREKMMIKEIKEKNKNKMGKVDKWYLDYNEL